MAQDQHTVESWNEKDQTIVVSQPKGFMFDLLLRARLDAAPEDVYAILTDPNSVEYFRNLKAVTYRNVVEDDGRGKRKIETGHRAFAKFLFVKVTFETHLLVEEDDTAMTVHFQNAREGFMKKFDGRWHVQPFNQDTLDKVYHQQHKHSPWHSAGSALSAIQQRLHLAPHADKSLVTLEQALLPKAIPPSAIQSVVRGLCARQLQCMMEDLRREAERRTELRREGMPVARYQAGQAVGGGSSASSGGSWFGRSGRAAAPVASLSAAALQLDLFQDCCCPLEITVQL